MFAGKKKPAVGSGPVPSAPVNAAEAMDVEVPVVHNVGLAAAVQEAGSRASTPVETPMTVQPALSVPIIQAPKIIKDEPAQFNFIPVEAPGHPQSKPMPRDVVDYVRKFISDHSISMQTIQANVRTVRIITSLFVIYRYLSLILCL